MFATTNRYTVLGKPAQLALIVIFILACVLFLTVFDVMYLDAEAENVNPSNGKLTSVARCHWQLGDPVMLNLKTKLGVNYDGGHWFHMAENLMTQHSIMRNEHLDIAATPSPGATASADVPVTPTSTATTTSPPHHTLESSQRYREVSHAQAVYLNFDKEPFLSDLNGVTRLLVALGLLGTTTTTTNAGSAGNAGGDVALATQEVYFTYLAGGHSAHDLPPTGAVVPLDDLHFKRCQRIDLSAGVNNSNRFILSQAESSGVVSCRNHQHQQQHQQQKVHLRMLKEAGEGASDSSLTRRSEGAASVSVSASASASAGAASYGDSKSIGAPSSSSSSGGGSGSGGSCIKFVYPNTVGGVWPTPQRGHWFPPPEQPLDETGHPLKTAAGRDEGEETATGAGAGRPSDLAAYYSKMDLLCPPALATIRTSSTPTTSTTNTATDTDTAALFTPNTYHISIYQRDLNRKIENLEETLSMINGYLIPRLQKAVKNKYQFKTQVIMHRNSRSPCEIRDLLSRTIVLLTPHGFQSLLTLFLPNQHAIRTYGQGGQDGGMSMPFIQPLLFEVFPYRYYKRAYGPLSKEIGIHHASAMSPALTTDRQHILSLITTSTCMLVSQYCREYARGDNVRFTTRGLNILLFETNTKIIPQFLSALPQVKAQAEPRVQLEAKAQGPSQAKAKAKAQVQAQSGGAQTMRKQQQ